MATRDTYRVLHETERRRRLALGLLVVAWGIQAIVTQSLLLREALVLMFGSEFAWGIVLFAWLFGVAGGGIIGGCLAQRLRGTDVALVVILVTLSLAACVELWIFRGARAWLDVGPGELLPLSKTALAAIAFVSPASALVGIAFPLACCITTTREPQASACAITPEPQASACADTASLGMDEPAPRGLNPAAREDAPRGSRSTAGKLLKLGNVYALESAGSLIGGAAFSFWAVEHLTPIQTALSCAAITTVASAGFLATTHRKQAGVDLGGSTVADPATPLNPPLPREHQGRAPHATVALPTIVTLRPRRPYGSLCLAALAVSVLLTLFLAGDALNRRLVDRRWRNVAPGYELRNEVESKYQNLAIGQRAEQFTLYCDGQVSADFPDPYTFVPLAHFWLCQHPDPRHVLVLGGGAEGLLAEILRHPVDHIDYVEPDPFQIELVKPYLAETDRRALGDERVTVHHLDARYFVKTQADRFDLVIARLPEPMSALRARLYTDEFYRELRHAMTAQSVLCMTAAATPGSLTTASAEYLASIRATLARHFSYIIIGWDSPAQILAATAPTLISTDPETLAGRYSQRRVDSKLFHPAWFDGATDWLDPDKLAQRAEELDTAGDVEVSTDLRPVIYMQRLALWEKMTGGRETNVIQRLRSVRWPELVATLLAIVGVTILACYVHARMSASRGSAHRDAAYSWLPRSAIILSVASTGFATMALSIVWLFAFQNLYGYVYQRIGWIIAIFMGGLVVGCEWANRRTARLAATPSLTIHLWRWLIAVDVLLALLALVIPFVLPALGALQTGPLALTAVEWCVSIMVALTGVLGGAAFPLAGSLQLEASGRAGAAAGVIVGADHAGACLGALFCGILLVPVFGTATTAILLAAIKLSSAALLILARRSSTTGS